jgi:hypothetical protein
MAYMDEIRIGDQVEIIMPGQTKPIGQAVVTRLKSDGTNGPDSLVTVCYADDLEVTYRPSFIRLIGTEDDGA